MTDQNLPVDLTSEEAKAVREWATDYLNGLYEVAPVTVARIVLDTVPEPPLPTMNKLPENERYDCHRMQCDVYGFTDRMVIVNIRSSSVDIMAEDGERWTIEDNRVTPRPDLPRMEWPGECPATVSPNELVEGSAWEDNDKLYDACYNSGRDQIIILDKDGDACVWNHAELWWDGMFPSRKSAPFTVFHTGKKVRDA